jgi:ankyrin repeat protein
MCYQKERALLKSHNNKHETPLHCAAKAGHKEVISKLIELAHSEGEVKLKEFVRDRNHNEETALHEAARHGHANVASVLMQEDSDLACLVNNEKTSPLYLATARGSIDVVRTMVEKLSDRVLEPEFYGGPNGQTALHAAVLRDAGKKHLIYLNYILPSP